jgi:hypothetical protein
VHYSCSHSGWRAHDRWNRRIEPSTSSLPLSLTNMNFAGWFGCLGAVKESIQDGLCQMLTSKRLAGGHTPAGSMQVLINIRFSSQSAKFSPKSHSRLLYSTYSIERLIGYPFNVDGLISARRATHVSGQNLIIICTIEVPESRSAFVAVMDGSGCPG